jgi:hypothetical protein
MADHFHWIDTTGGPHVLGAVESLKGWGGIEGWHDNGPEDESDYARACAVRRYLGKIPSADGDIVVLSGDRGPIAWVPNADVRGGVLVQCLASDGEDALLALLRDWENTNMGQRSYAEELEFDTGPSGVMTFFDSAESGSGGSLDSREIFTLRPGRYRLLASYVETDDCMVVLRDLRADPGERTTS